MSIPGFNSNDRYFRWHLQGPTIYRESEEQLNYDALVVTCEKKADRDPALSLKGKAIEILTEIEKSLRKNTLVIDIEGVESVGAIAQTILQGCWAKRGWCSWIWDIIQWIRGVDTEIKKVDRLVRKILDNEEKKPDYEKAFCGLRKQLFLFSKEKYFDKLCLLEEKAKRRELLAPLVKVLEGGDVSSARDAIVERAIQELCKWRFGRIETSGGEAAELLFFCEFSDPEVKKRAQIYVEENLEMETSAAPRPLKPVEYSPKDFILPLVRRGCFESAFRIADKIEDVNEKRALEIGMLVRNGKIDEAIDALLTLEEELFKSAERYIWLTFNAYSSEELNPPNFINALTVRGAYDAALKYGQKFYPSSVSVLKESQKQKCTYFEACGLFYRYG